MLWPSIQGPLSSHAPWGQWWTLVGWWVTSTLPPAVRSCDIRLWTLLDWMHALYRNASLHGHSQEGERQGLPSIDPATNPLQTKGGM